MSEYAEQLQKICNSSYDDQAVWYLNAYWKQDPIHFSDNLDKAERLYEIYKECVDFNGRNQTAVGRTKGMRILEKFECTKPFNDFKAACQNFDPEWEDTTPLTYLLLIYFEANVKNLVNSNNAQSDNGKGLKDASEYLEYCRNKLHNNTNNAKLANEKLEAAEKALEESKLKHAEAIKAVEEAKTEGNEKQLSIADAARQIAEEEENESKVNHKEALENFEDMEVDRIESDLAFKRAEDELSDAQKKDSERGLGLAWWLERHVHAMKRYLNPKKLKLMNATPKDELTLSFIKSLYDKN